ncbi:MAG TPA: hypothetical protein VM324_04705 [Egibacteraceae bacterium]|jgi:hypothetical protein|nr:hypothetical protein [Egibacteraceae bacterium]
MTGEGLRDMVLQLVGNMFLAAAAMGAVMFLFRREFVRFAEFAALSVFVATFVFVPEIWIGVGRSVAAIIGADAGAAG